MKTSRRGAEHAEEEKGDKKEKKASQPFTFLPLTFYLFFRKLGFIFHNFIRKSAKNIFIFFSFFAIKMIICALIHMEAKMKKRKRYKHLNHLNDLLFNMIMGEKGDEGTG